MAFQLFHSTPRSSVDQPLHRRRTLQTQIAQVKDAHLFFWQKHPALLAALTLLIGTSAFPFWGHLLWPLLWCAYLLFCRFTPQIALLIGALFYGWGSMPPSSLPQGEITALFSPASIQPYHSPFQKGLLYKGTLSLDHTKLPCSITYRGSLERRPKGDVHFLVTGTLTARQSGFFFKTRHWEPLSPAWTLAELRYQTKEIFKEQLKRHFPSPRVSLFLGSLLTGDIEERLLRYEFSRLGLQHILAISGFHFGILIAFCSFALGLFLPRSWKIGALFVAVTAYFFFVGSSPSVQRSWLTALFYLLGQFLNRPSNGLNLLGAALAVELICDPLVSNQLAFQLSFLSCAGILLFHPTVNQKLQTLFPKRSWKKIQELSLLDKHGALLSSFFRQSLSLTLSVNLLLWPLLLYHFHSFPLLSLLYNLFFPFLVGIALFLALLSLLIHLFFAPLAIPIFWFTDRFTSQLLTLVSHPPSPLDYSIQVSSFPAWLIPLFLFALFNLHILTNRSTSDRISSIYT